MRIDWMEQLYHRIGRRPTLPASQALRSRRLIYEKGQPALVAECLPERSMELHITMIGFP
jgi:hypothetical protein